MAERKHILRVREEVGCPIFRAGDQMTIDLPGVDRAMSTNLCVYALAKFIEERVKPRAPQCDSPATSNLHTSEFLCPRLSAPVVFDVFEVEDHVESIPM